MDGRFELRAASIPSRDGVCSDGQVWQTFWSERRGRRRGLDVRARMEDEEREAAPRGSGQLQGKYGRRATARRCHGLARRGARELPSRTFGAPLLMTWQPA
jgi:hypothetical protein